MIGYNHTKRPRYLSAEEEGREGRKPVYATNLINPCASKTAFYDKFMTIEYTYIQTHAIISHILILRVYFYFPKQLDNMITCGTIYP